MTATVRTVGQALAEMRARRGITQSELAKRLRVSQVNVSRIERAPDLHVATLTSYIEALGGRLEFAAEFDQSDVIAIADVRDQLEANPADEDEDPTWRFDSQGRSEMVWRSGGDRVAVTLPKSR